DADGHIIKDLDKTAIQQAAQTLGDLELDNSVVSFINAYDNSKHEQQTVEILEESDAGERVVAATSIAREIQEYEHNSTTAINAFITPKISGYIQRLEQGLTATGVTTRWRIMQSSGGLLNPTDAAEYPARTVLSGLAGGVVGAANWSKHLGLSRVVSFDIGGTSTDIALIRDGVPDE